jgi:hypothetical protein
MVPTADRGRDGTRAAREVPTPKAGTGRGGARAFKWLDARSVWQSRNDVLAGRGADPTNALRRHWMAALRARDGRGDLVVGQWAGREQVAFTLLGDTGEGDRSQVVAADVALRLQERSDFLLVASDLIYPAGDVNQYAEKFYAMYAGWDKPILGVPGNHDWYDELEGFMFHMCGVDSPRPEAAAVPRPALWRAPRKVGEEARRLRDTRPAGRGGFQPAPYFAIDAGPIAIVAIDTGIGGWLQEVSERLPQPKVLVTGKPLIVNGRYRPGHVAGLDRTVDAIVRDPRHGYVAAIGGDVHNFQRYPVQVGGRTIQYIVAGGGGAFMHATHQIGRVDLGGTDENQFRCFPLRGDSLAFYARRVVPALVRLVDIASLALLLAVAVVAGMLVVFADWLDSWGWGALHAALLGGPLLVAAILAWRWVERIQAREALALRGVALTPEQASSWVAEQLGVKVAVGAAEPLTDAQRRLAGFVAPRMAANRGVFHRYLSEILDADDPPLYKHALHLAADARTLTITCHPANGLERPDEPVAIEDQVVIELEPVRAAMARARG